MISKINGKDIIQMRERLNALDIKENRCNKTLKKNFKKKKKQQENLSCKSRYYKMIL